MSACLLIPMLGGYICPGKIKDGVFNLFDNENPIYLEIGCGKGRFITETAKLNPDINFLAAEKNRKARAHLDLSKLVNIKMAIM